MKCIFKLLLICLLFSLFPGVVYAKKKKIPIIKVGHVGHDHQTALYVACLEGERFKKDYDLYLKPVKEKKLYELYDRGKKIAEIELYRAGGGSKMPTMMSQGHFEIGLGGVAAVAFFTDKGSPMRIISPLHNKGDMLVVVPSIEVNSWKEFCEWVKSKPEQVRIGYKNPVAVAKLIFERALEEENISFTGDKGNTDAQILMVHMKGERNLIPGLQNKIIDGYVSNNPWCAIAESKKAGRIVCELHNLPPGIWENHPCCCVAATDKLIKEKRKIASRFLELIVIATKYMNEEPEVGFRCASKWIGTSLDVERKSMPTSGYSTEPDEEWKQRMYIWCNEMNQMGKLKGILKDKKPKVIDKLLFNFTLLKDANKDLKKRIKSKTKR